MARKKPFSNGLSAAEVERLAILNEEMAEAQQIVSKILRHGYESSDPTKEVKTTNRLLLAEELGHVEAAIIALSQRGDVRASLVFRSCDQRPAKIAKYLHHQEG